MTTFTTRDIVIPESPTGPSDSQPAAASHHSARSAGSGPNDAIGMGPGGTQQPPLPALPDSLMQALAREPPPPTQSTRTSLSVQRPHLNGEGGTASSTPRLPSIPPQSPFDVPSYPSSPSSPSASRSPFFQQPQSAPHTAPQPSPLGFSTNRTTATPLPAAHAELSSSSFSTNRSPPLTFSPSPPLQPHTSKRNMFKSFAFGRSRSTTVPAPAPDPSSSSLRPPLPPTRFSPSPAPPSSQSLGSRSASFGSSSPSPSLSPSLSPQPPASSYSPSLAPPIPHLSSSPSSVVQRPTKSVMEKRMFPHHDERAEEDRRDLPTLPRAWSTEYASTTTRERFTRDLEREHEVSEYGSEMGEGEAEGEGDGSQEGGLGVPRIGFGGAEVEVEEGGLIDDGESFSDADADADADMEEREDQGEDHDQGRHREGDGEGVQRVEGLAVSPGLASLTTPTARGGRRKLRSENTTGEREGEEYFAGAEDRNAAGPGRREFERQRGQAQRRREPSPTSLADFVVTIIGPRSAGKTTVIKHGLKRWTSKDTRIILEDEFGNRVTTTTTTFTMAQQRRTIEVVEMDMHLLKFSDQGVMWPDGVPQCEGAMLCYDSTDSTSLTSLHTLLHSFWTRGYTIPTIVLATKASSDPTRPNAVDPLDAASLCNVFGAGLAQLDGGIADPERKAKTCFDWVVRTILTNRGEMVRRPTSLASTSSLSLQNSRRGSLRTTTNPLTYATTTLSHGTSSSSPITSSPKSPHPSSSSASASVEGSPTSSSTRSVAASTASTSARPPRLGGLTRQDSLGLGLSVVQEAPVMNVALPLSQAAARTRSRSEIETETDAEAVQAALDQEAEEALRVALGDLGVGGGGPGALELELESGVGHGEGVGEGEQVRRPSVARTVESLAASAEVAGRVENGSGIGAGGGTGRGARDAMRGAVVLPQPTDRRSSKTAALDLYFKREDVIDKFLFAAVSGNDDTFVTMFLITYRRFARPYDVLEKLIDRFEFVASRHKTDPLLSRFGQMKLCGVLATWMQTYPGDFTAPTTFGLLQPFLEGLLPRGATWVAHFALELVPLLSPISAMGDPESSWALPDKPLDAPFTAGAFSPQIPGMPLRRPSLAPSYDSASSLAPSHPLSQTVSRLSVPASIDTSDSSSIPPTSSFSPRLDSDTATLDTQDSGRDGLGALTHSGNGGSVGSSSGTGAGAGKDAASSLLRSGGKYPSSAVLVDVSNAVLEMSEEDVAMQITRLAWEQFSGMSPRDLIRHVLAPRDPANPRVALRSSESPVMRSIAYVNYLANWTATLILVQGKIKSRTRMLEKMLMVAVALREQENFDSLMGVLAGLNSQPIFRLHDTWDLVTTKFDGDPRLQPQRPEQPDGDKNRFPKKLRSLNRLMSATKSFAAYRMALAGSGANMIPYLGVHLQDITAVNEVKTDLRDGKVNWSKFQQMGRSAATVLDCARVAPQLPIDRTIERCISNTPVLDEERQYTLSYAHQPRQGGKNGTRAKLRGLAKATLEFATT
ncbi:hypothetical protein JCM11641_000874 [Rhodosporidiobolus odoratus]